MKPKLSFYLRYKSQLPMRIRTRKSVRFGTRFLRTGFTTVGMGWEGNKFVVVVK